MIQRAIIRLLPEEQPPAKPTLVLMRLYIATTNPGKLRDFAHAAQGSLLAGAAVEIEPLPGLAGIAVPPEDEPSFAANARDKALYYSRHAPGLMIVADDSGLEADALNGRPGVRSARYAEDLNFSSAPDLTVDERNNAALLRALEGIPDARRQARYHCVLALARDGAIVATAEGTVEGRILTVPRGGSGFGYDPIFLIPELNRTMAELDPVTRLGFSHRGRALRVLLQRLDGI
jgi:XTP/dITP diphosphohydrolase